MSTPDRMPADLDPALARAWREASGDEPPERVDDAIRAAARRAVQATPRPAGRSFVQRWRVPLSIAALLVVSASLTLMISQRDAHLPTAAPSAVDRAAPAPGDGAERGVAREVLPPAQYRKWTAPPAGPVVQPPLSAEAARAQPRAPTAGAAAPQAAAPAAANTQAAEHKEVGESAALPEGDVPDAARPAQPPAAPKVEVPAAPEMRDEPPAAGEEAPSAGAPRVMQAQPAAEARTKREGASDLESMMREPQTADEAEPPPGRARLKLRARPSAPAPSPHDAEPSPDQWIERIRELRREGLAAEADASLKEFRERYPEFALPADLAAPSREP